LTTGTVVKRSLRIRYRHRILTAMVTIFHIFYEQIPEGCWQSTA
jgi:hypothetical protein